MLVVEVDGVHHALPEQTEHDRKRDAYLTECGFRILRVPAVDAGHELDGVMHEIRAELGEIRHGPSIGPLQQNGGARYRQITRLGLKLKPDPS
jgi:very-short-patch-repair endonuclease